MTQVSNEMHAANSEFSSVEANANASERVGPLSATVRDNDKDRVEELKLFLEIQNSAMVNILVKIMISPSHNKKRLLFIAADYDYDNQNIIIAPSTRRTCTCSLANS